ncbi:hypothetical protein [Cellulomonas fengjieae]|uniref:hypothetical protein n=1 Tax=Cellulomonas fengjieae TaxID=2819978 RepID=UPI001AAEAA2B|nr:hypothetical protein [Cellulomonas fengjieae]MBO3103647.1 hypothetical protein [Cellulomonas fengjieae]
MDRFLVPTDVADALAAAGFEPVAVAGAGWLAVASDGSERRLELHVVAAVADAGLTERARRMRALRHEHLPRVLDVVELSPGRTGLVVEHVDGLTLEQVRTSRAPLADGEAATVAIPVAGALDALHRAGLAHGAVSGSSIVVRPDGRPMLTELRGALTGAADAEGDVRRLVSTVLAQMPDADVHLVADPAGAPCLREALTDLLTLPGLGADQVVDRCFEATEPAPVRLPDAGARASSALAAIARGHDPAAGASRRQRRRRRLRGRVLAATLTVAVLLGGGAVAWRHLDRPSSGAPAAPSDDPVRAAIELSSARTQIVRSGDAARLVDVEIADGPAHAADTRLLDGLGGATVDGLTVDVRDAWLVPDDGTRGGTTDVAVTAVMSAHSRVTDDGAVTAVPASPARTVVLGLRWTAHGWRVWDVVEQQ